MIKQAPANDLVPLADRFAVLQGVRAVMVLAVLGVAIGLPQVLTAPGGRLVMASAAYLACTSGIELARRGAHARGLLSLSGVLLLDGLFIGLVIAWTGGPQSLLLSLVHLHVIAVTLLVSYRTGLKVAVWHALLLFLAQAMAGAGAFGDSAVGDVDGSTAAALHALAFLVVAVGAASFSSVNERALRRSRTELRALVSMGADLEEVLRDDEVVLTLLAHVRHRLDFGRVAVVTRRDGGWWGALDQGRGAVLVETTGPAAAVMTRTWSSRRPELVRSLGVDDDLLARILPDARNVVIAPLAVDGEGIGVVVAEMGGSLATRVPAQTVDTLAQSASHAALSLRNARLLAQVEDLATRDSLTGLANRRVFEDTLEREVAISRRSGSALGLVVLDVDEFKAVNDTHGHQVGDEVLREVGAALSRCCRAGDLAARYGGEEFVVLLPGCTSAEAVETAERLRHAVSSGVRSAAVTISAGVATLPDNAADADRLVAAADAALYRAKRGGRNRTVRSRRGQRLVRLAAAGVG